MTTTTVYTVTVCAGGARHFWDVYVMTDGTITETLLAGCCRKAVVVKRNWSG